MKEKKTKLRGYIRKHPMFTTVLSALFDIVYGLLYGFLAYRGSSYWFLTLCVYYLIIGIMRLILTTMDLKDEKVESRALKIYGFCFLFLSIIFSGLTFLTIYENRNMNKNQIVMIAIATYTFAILIMAIVNTIKARKSSSVKMIILRNISLIAAAGSMMSLTRGMLGTFADGQSDFAFIMNAVSGALVFILTLYISVKMIKNKKVIL
ncbi:MAG: hypothetical protein IJI66_04410 [Erysipelotrichaceae bacterium]|nr:hypothetical protein [Erysipelotrichaceae bacterium]